MTRLLSQTALLVLTIFVTTGMLSPVCAGGKKEPKIQVSFHFQADQTDGRAFAFAPPEIGTQTFFRRTPDFTNKDFLSFRPFPASDGMTYGIVLQMNRILARRLSHLTTANQGRYLLSVVNGRPRDAVYIDRPINDGIIVIWKGISQVEVQMLNRTFPRTGEDPKEWKKRLKREKKRR